MAESNLKPDNGGHT